MNKVAYISIPISGMDYQVQYFKSLSIQTKLENEGFEVVNPFHLGMMLRASYLNIAGREPTYEDYMREDLANLETCTHIFLCNGWSYSNGCIDEVDQSIRDNLIFLFESNYKFN